MQTTRYQRLFDSIVSSRSGLLTFMLGAALVWLVPHAQARPGNPQVIHGNVTFEHHGNHTIIRASNGSIIQYLNFNIGPNEIVRFIQPNELSRVLNRIKGNEPTFIQGRLLANGQVYIVNPAGVIFGNGAVVDVGGIFAAAGRLTDARFLAGNNTFTGLNGPVVNEGSIKGANVALLGESVANHGNITATGGGIIAMVAGDQVVLTQHGEHLSVKVDGKTLTNQSHPHHGTSTPDMTASPGVENTGTITASRGQVILGAGDMYSLAIRNSGTISASKGQVTIAAADGLIHNTATGVISADAVSGSAGDVVVQGPSVLNSGRISADSDNGHAGSVEVTSQDHSYFTASSVVSAGGGTGNAHGGNVLIHSYEGHTAVAHGALVDVSGGSAGGDAGFAEVSGHFLSFDGRVDLRARPGYERGTVLFDPFHLIINDTGGDDDLLSGNIISFDEPNTSQNVYISDEALEAITGHIILQATGDITIAHQVDLIHFNDVTLEAYQNIYMLESINGMHDFTATADADHNGYGDLYLSAPLAIGGKGVFNGHDTFINTPSIISASTMDFLGPADLCVDASLTATQVHFHSTVNDTIPGEQSLTINGPGGADGVAIFGGAVGGERKLELLRVNGRSNVNGGLVVTKKFQKYFGPVNLGHDTVMTSTDAGEIRFGGTLDGNHDLLVQTAGLTRFDGNSGSLAKLDSITTDSPGTTRLAGNMNAGVIALNDQVLLARSVTLTGTESVEFAQTIAGGGHSLIINSPQTGFHGDVTNINLLQTDAVGQTDIEADITGNKLDFNDKVKLLSDSILTGRDFVDFDRTVDGPFNLTTNSDHQVRFGSDVGGAQALQSLTTHVGTPDSIDENLILIDGNLIRATGDVTFNPAGLSAPGRVATISARNFGGLTVDSANGDIFMGPNEKFTSLGNLKLIAPNGSVTLGDLNAFGNLLIDSPDIMLYARHGGQVLNFHGQYVDDNQASYVVFGNVTVTSKPTLIGDGPTPIIATKVLDNLTGPLGDFLRAAFATLSAANFVYGGTILDLSATPQFSPPTDLATVYTKGPAPLRDFVPYDPFALRPMERLAIYMRTLDNQELREKLTGRETYDDLPESTTEPPQDRTIVVNRLRRNSVLNVLDTFAGMFIKQEVPDRSRPPTEEEDQTPYIKAALAKAWTSYLDREAASGEGGRLDPANFRAFLETQPDQAEALAYLDSLHSMFHQIWIMGATKLELRNSVNGMLRPIVPDNMNQDQLEQAIDVDSTS